MTWGCQAGVEPANLTTVMITDKTTPTKSYATIKLGINAHAKWYYVARQLDGATPQPAQPQDWDERGKGVKTDRIDALALCQRLDRYVRGNRKAFSVVRVPSEEEERERALSRQRQQLVRERQRLQVMGRSLLAMHGIHVTEKWWKGKTWAMIRSEAPGWVVERLEIFIRLIEPVEAEERHLTEAIQEAARDRKIPKESAH